MNSQSYSKTFFQAVAGRRVVGREAARRLGLPFGIIALSLAPTPVPVNSVARSLKRWALNARDARNHRRVGVVDRCGKKGGAWPVASRRHERRFHSRFGRRGQ